VIQQVYDTIFKKNVNMNIIFFLLGGNMAVVVERHLRREQKSIIRGVLLLYPLLQLVNFCLPSYRTYLPYRLLSLLREDMLVQVANFYINTSFSEDILFNNRHLSLDDYNKFYSKLNLKISKKENDDINKYQFLSESSHPDTWKLFNENISPLLADDDILRNSPPTFIVACTYDVLLSDAQLYFHRLQQLNVKNVIYREYQIFHGVMTFVDFPVAFNEAFDIINDSAQFIVNRTTLIK
jgi:acetyl esterase/lipase